METGGGGVGKVECKSSEKRLSGLAKNILEGNCFCRGLLQPPKGRSLTERELRHGRELNSAEWEKKI